MFLKKFMFLTILNLHSLALASGDDNLKIDEIEIPLFAGEITQNSVNRFIEKYDSKDIRQIRVFSQGGNMLAGLRFATWVRKKGLDVRVKMLCMSSCANYVFMAGANKYIEKGGVVIWHGSIKQKNVQDLVKKYDQLEEKRASEITLANDEVQFLEQNRLKVEDAKEVSVQQDALYLDLGVDEYITRLGQVPKRYKVDGWTATVDLMNRMGIMNVFAELDYGTENYMKSNPIARIAAKGEPIVFGMSENGKIYPLSGDQRIFDEDD